MTVIIKFIFNISNFGIVVCFLTKLLILGILFSTVANAVFVAKLLVSRILSSISVILELEPVFLTRPLVSIFSTLVTNLL